jgi:hypothetical protein
MTRIQRKETFSAEKSHFQPIAATSWGAILEHLYSEIAAEPPFHRGPLDMLSLLQINIKHFFGGERGLNSVSKV